MTQIVNDLAQMDIAENSIGIWFTQAHSCQRDLILAAKTAPFNLPIHVVASHADDRPEITSVADIALQEPPFSERVEWVLQQAQRLNVKLIIAGHHAAIYLAEKHRFEQLGIRLMAGCDTLDQIEQLNDKSLFTQICLNHSLAVAPATIVENAEQLQDAYHDWRQKGEVCVKPAKGVFASGFWHLDPSANSFDVFANSMRFKAHPESFIESYRQLEKPPVYLVMPFLSGLECSVDMLCIHGQVHGAIARYKQKNGCQNLTFEDPAIELAYQVAALFGCDGLVNMQARYNDQQQLYILEVNSRPSGGIAHTFMSGVNLVHLAIAHTLLLHYQPKKTEGSLIVRSISQSICVI
ncbi:ATP-grasp domain-containing protein [Acinetobacter baylyi]|uniref:ATP-grasp domain-containing protein n=1 Tax=Acinetobacter baylyi TaxID=202950 RepID=UPI000EA23620|nr:ATP-grasp domain-containing protein [Acinetobacter baylyi]